MEVFTDPNVAISCIVVVSNTSGHVPLLNLLLEQQELSQLAFTCSKLTIETIGQGMKYVQS